MSFTAAHGWSPAGGGAALTLADLASRREGWRVRGASARGPCPVCGSRTGGWAQVHDDGLPRVGCFSCGDWRGLLLAFGLDGGSPLAGRPFHPPPSDSLEPAPDLVADAGILDAVYRVLLDAFPLSAEGRRNALGRDRGIPPEIRETMPPLLGPVPSGPDWPRRHGAIVAALRRVAPDAFLRRVPELSARAGGSFAVLPARRRALYFEPWADELGRVVALRAYMGRRAPVKYLTSKGRVGPLVHFAFGVPRAQAARAPWVFTEGWMKAEVAARHLGAAGVGFPGVTARSSWRRAIQVKAALAPEAPAYVAFDAEVWLTRLDLARAALELAFELEEAAGRPAGFAVWDATVDAEGKVTPKGIDDAVAAGVEVRLVPRAGFAAVLEPTVDAWEGADAA